MNGARRKICGLVLAATAVVTVGSCSRPDANPAVRITGDRSLAIPSTEPTTSTSTTVAPTTTLFYGDGGAGDAIANETTTSTTSTTTEPEAG